MLRVGDTVTVRRAVSPYYSGYGQNPSVMVAPGMVGVVAVIDVPYVTGNNRASFICVDFDIEGRTWRTGEPASTYGRVA